MNIYIIGLPLSGKKNIASCIQQLLNYPIININIEMEQKAILSNSLYELYTKIGHHTYLAYENSTIKSYANNHNNTIFIIPNTTLNNTTIQDLLHNTGIIIYVKTEFKDFLCKYINHNKYLLLYHNTQKNFNYKDYNQDEDIFNIYKYYDSLFSSLTKNIMYYTNDDNHNKNTLKKIIEI